jgi:hypothetical protein
MPAAVPANSLCPASLLKGHSFFVLTGRSPAVDNARMSLSEILLIIALIVFVVAAIGWSYKKTDLVCVGLALWSLSELINRGLSSLTLSTILLILAFIAFVLGAIGWGYKKIGLIAVGLALWVASIVLPMIIH